MQMCLGVVASWRSPFLSPRMARMFCVLPSALRLCCICITIIAACIQRMKCGCRNLICCCACGTRCLLDYCALSQGGFAPACLIFVESLVVIPLRQIASGNLRRLWLRASKRVSVVDQSRWAAFVEKLVLEHWLQRIVF